MCPPRISLVKNRWIIWMTTGPNGTWQLFSCQLDLSSEVSLDGGRGRAPMASLPLRDASLHHPESQSQATVCWGHSLSSELSEAWNLVGPVSLPQHPGALSSWRTSWPARRQSLSTSCSASWLPQELGSVYELYDLSSCLPAAHSGTLSEGLRDLVPRRHFPNSGRSQCTTDVLPKEQKQHGLSRLVARTGHIGDQLLDVARATPSWCQGDGWIPCWAQAWKHLGDGSMLPLPFARRAHPRNGDPGRRKTWQCHIRGIFLPDPPPPAPRHLPRPGLSDSGSGDSSAASHCAHQLQRQPCSGQVSLGWRGCKSPPARCESWHRSAVPFSASANGVQWPVCRAPPACTHPRISWTLPECCPPPRSEGSGAGWPNWLGAATPRCQQFPSRRATSSSPLHPKQWPKSVSAHLHFWSSGKDTEAPQESFSPMQSLELHGWQNVVEQSSPTLQQLQHLLQELCVKLEGSPAPSLRIVYVSQGAEVFSSGCQHIHATPCLCWCCCWHSRHYTQKYNFTPLVVASKSNKHESSQSAFRHQI